jgi:hypothetical protein
VRLVPLDGSLLAICQAQALTNLRLDQCPRDANFESNCGDVCETSRLAPKRADLGIETLSIDETTRVQASERAAPTRAMVPGRCERTE